MSIYPRDLIYQASGLPIVVDLDGTLLRTDSLHETFFNLLREKPISLWRLPLKLIAGRSATKAFLAKEASLMAETWPVNGQVVDYLEEQARAGRKIVLATAANRSVGEAIAERFSFISEVIASSPDVNMKGERKARQLQERFPQGFIYAGDSEADLAVWRESSGVIIVNAAGAVESQARELGEPIKVFDSEPFNWSVLYRTMRLHQWAKNALVFVPVILGGKAGDPWTWLLALAGFVALGLAASATYIVNDLWDLPSDRQHWSKRFRPLASGELSLRSGTLVALTGLALGMVFAALLGMQALATLTAYIVVTLAYSFYFKRIPILDVFLIASLFTLRLGFGIVLAQVELSPWLLVFSMFVFLSLSMAKRHTEVLRLAERDIEQASGRGYRTTDTPLTLGIGLASMLGAVMIMILYLIEDAFSRSIYHSPEALWAVPSVLFFFLGRIWLLSQRGELHDDPVAFALKDRVSLGLGLLMVASVSIAIIGVN